MNTPAADRLAPPALVALPLQANAEPIVIPSAITLVGRQEFCQVVLGSASVSKLHCLLVRLGGRWVIRDLLSREGTLLNGQPISGGEIASGDELQVGRLRFGLELGSGEPPGDAGLPALPAVTIRAPATEGELPLAPVVTLLGSRAGCEIELRDHEIDPVHAAVVRTPEGVWVLDLGSRGGVRVNDGPADRQQLRTGDRVQLGPFTFLVAIAGPDEASAAKPPAEFTVPRDRPTRQKLFKKMRQQLRLHREKSADQQTSRDTDEPQAETLLQAVAELENERRLLDQSSARLASQQSEVDRERLELDQGSAELDARAKQLDQALAEIERTRSELRLQADQLQQAPAVPTAPPLPADLAEQKGRLAEQAQTLNQDLQRLAEQSEELRSRQRRLQQEHEDLEAIRQTISDERQHLREERERVLAEQEALAAREGRLDQRAADFEDMLARLEQDRQRVRSERDGLGVQAEQLESQRLSLAAERDALAARVEELESQRQVLAAQREQLAVQQAELGKQRCELDAERQQFHATRQESQKELVADRQRLAAADQELAAQRRTAEAESQALAELRAELEQTRKTLDQQREDWQLTQQQQGEQLQLRQKELADHSDKLDQQTRQLEGREHELQQRQHVAESQLRQVQQRQEDLKHLADNLQRRQEALSSLEAELDEQRQLLDQRRGQWGEQEQALEDRQSALQACRGELQRQEQQLEARRALLEEQEAAADQTRAASQAQQGELAEARSAIQALQAELARSQQQLADDNRQLEEREVCLQAEAKRLDEQRHQLSVHREQQAEQQRQTERELAAQARQLAARQEEHQRAERKLAERQSALAAREEVLLNQSGQTDQLRQKAPPDVGRLRAELEAERTAWLRDEEDKLLQRRRDQDAEHQQRVAALQEQMAAARGEREALLRGAPAAGGPFMPAPTRPRWGLTLAVSLGLCLVGAWLTHQLWPKRYRAADLLAVKTIAFPPEPALRGHLAALLDGQRIEQVAAALGIASPELSVSGQVDGDGGTIRLGVEASGGGLAASVVRRLLEGYAQQVNEQAALATPTRQMELLNEKRALLAERRQQLLKQIEQLQVAADDESPIEHVQRLTESADQLRPEHQELGARQEQLEARLKRLQADPDALRGTVEKTQLQQAQLKDRELQQDLDQWRMHRRKFREELIAALQAALPRLKAMDQALGGLQKVVSEQRQAEPPADVARVVQAVGQAQSELGDTYQQFVARWRAQLSAAQDVTDKPDQQDLLGVQAEAESQLRGYLEKSQPMLTTLQEQVRRLSEPGERTAQRTVAQNALAGQVYAVLAAQAEVASAAARVALTSNFRLDAASKTIRGLSHRIADRQGQIEGRLQAEADRLAEQAHQGRVDQAEGELSAVRTRMRQVLADYWRLASELDAARPEAEQLRARSQRLELSRVRLEQIEGQLGELDGRLRQLPEASPQPDTAEYSPAASPEVVLLGGSGVVVAMASASVLVFLACWLGSGVAGGLIRGPRRG